MSPRDRLRHGRATLGHGTRPSIDVRRSTTVNSNVHPLPLLPNRGERIDVIVPRHERQVMVHDTVAQCERRARINTSPSATPVAW